MMLTTPVDTASKVLMQTIAPCFCRAEVQAPTSKVQTTSQLRIAALDMKGRGGHSMGASCPASGCWLLLRVAVHPTTAEVDCQSVDSYNLPLSVHLLKHPPCLRISLLQLWLANAH